MSKKFLKALKEIESKHIIKKNLKTILLYF